MSDGKISVRIGIKGGVVPFFPNAGVVVVQLDTEEQWESLQQAATVIRTILAVTGQRVQFVCERR